MLVRATLFGSFFDRRNRNSRCPRKHRGMRSVLSIGNHHAECADSGGRSARRVGDFCIRNDECCIGRSAAMGYKYLVSLHNVAVFSQKVTIFLHRCKIYCIFAGNL